MMHAWLRWIVGLLLMGAGMAFPLAPAQAALQVFACEPEWGALVRELGGERVSVYEATTAFQDVHRIQAKPSLLAAFRRADLAVCTGADLEIGWLPILFAEAGNPKVQPGKPGYFEASRYVTLLEVPATLDRSLGDQHPAGNPHIHLDPRNILKVGEALAQRLAELDPEHGARYRSRYRDFAGRWQQAMSRWEAQGAPLRGTPVIVHHKGFPYLNAWLGLKQVGALEPKPGIEPTASHLAQLLEAHKREPARMVIRAPYNSPRAAEWFARQAGIPQVVLPYTVGGSEKAKDLFGLFDDTLERLLAAASAPSRTGEPDAPSSLNVGRTTPGAKPEAFHNG
ncbi:MAG: zinc ABC transporter substrate-binding protein [Burkholderiales bacterium]|nr:MAG: zinc ABC transporter substrate-binding protein [Burkholderiales bacterium]